MAEINLDWDLRNIFDDYKCVFLNSKKYWLIYLALIFVGFISFIKVSNYLNPILEISSLIVFAVAGVFCICYYQLHCDEEELYKTVFVIILIFGILFALILPICASADEVEHFVRAELTSRGEFVPHYHLENYTYEGTAQNGYYLTIQSVLDLIDRGKETWVSGFDHIDYNNATILKTDADTNPINNSFARYHNAFAQNPFYGYVAPAIGIAIAKLLDLNAIYLLWFGRVCNVLLYAVLISLAIRKTPILKVPLMVVSLMPLFLLQTSSLSIDAMVGGLGIYSIALFFYMYKSPKGSLDYKDILKFAFVVLLLGLCKVSFFAFILLVLFVPLSNFKDRKYYLCGIFSIFCLFVLFLLWTKFYMDPVILNSSRHIGSLGTPRTASQIDFLMTHKKKALISISHYLTQLKVDLMFISAFNSIYLMFLGGVFLFYPSERFDLKSKLGALFVFLTVYIGTYLIFLITYSKPGSLVVTGVWPRYFYPAFGLIPFTFGINHSNIDKTEINSYIIMISIAFIAIQLIYMIVEYY